MAKVAHPDNDICAVRFMQLAMSEITLIHASKQPRRPHYIEAWAELRGLSQADIARDALDG